MNMNIYDNDGIGKRIQQLRKMNGYTREIFSAKVNISPKFLYEIEKGQKGFSVEILSRIANELSVTCDYIVRGNKQNDYEDELSEALNLFTVSQKKELVNLLKTTYKLSSMKYQFNIS